MVLGVPILKHFRVHISAMWLYKRDFAVVKGHLLAYMPYHKIIACVAHRIMNEIVLRRQLTSLKCFNTNDIEHRKK